MDRLNCTHEAKRKGFNLIESAFVLGIVGIVLGAIWYAAASYYENYKVNKTVEGILTIMRNTKNLVSLREALAQWGYAGTNVTSDAIKLNVFPQDWVNNKKIYAPSGNQIYFLDYSNYSSSGNIANNAFSIQSADTLDKSTCIKLVIKLSETNRRNDPNGLTLISVNFATPSDWHKNIPNFPVTPSEAQTACSYDKTNKLYVYFRYPPTR